MDRYQISEKTLAIIRALAPKHYATFRGVPDTLEKLRTAYELARRTNSPLPVYAGGCEFTIYGTPEDNHAFRAWHDAWHIKLGAEFDEIGELQVALAQFGELMEHGADHEDARAVFVDVRGQFQYQRKHGAFPDDQAAFVAAYLRHAPSALARTSFPATPLAA